MQTISKTSTRLIEMLTENTGVHFLDSGMSNGRHWQQNQGHTVEEWLNRPTATLDLDYGMCVYVDTFHFLNDRLRLTEKAEQLQNYWNDFIESSNERSYYDCYAMEEFAELVNDGTGENATPRIVNTYNFENLLTQTLQYVEFNHEGDSFILLQIHGGADVRGGYTRPQVFEMLDGYYFAYEMQNCEISCTNSDCTFYLDVRGPDVSDEDSNYYGNGELNELKKCPRCNSELKAHAPWVN